MLLTSLYRQAAIIFLNPFRQSQPFPIPNKGYYGLLLRAASGGGMMAVRPTLPNGVDLMTPTLVEMPSTGINSGPSLSESLSLPKSPATVAGRDDGNAARPSSVANRTKTMNDRTKRAILKYIADHDPKGDVVRLEPTDDLKGGKVTFSPRMTDHRRESVLKPEKYVEAYLAVRLASVLRYPVEAFELQKAYPVGHAKAEADRPRIDMIVRQLGDAGFRRAFFFIEAKDPEEFERSRSGAIERQLFLLADHERAKGLKYLVYFTVALKPQGLVERAELIDFEKFPTFDAWNDSGQPSLDLFPAEYGLARKARYVNKKVGDLNDDEKCLDVNAGPEVFAALRNNLHDVLWGGGGMFYNDIFTNLVKLFLAKIYDEQTTPEGEAYRFQVEAVGDLPQSPDDVADKIGKLFRSAQTNYLGYTDAQVRESKGIDTEKISKNKVAYVVERLQEFSLVENRNPENGDVLGGFFEGIVEKGFKQSRGQFFTHGNIVRFLMHALQIPESAVQLAGGEGRAAPRLPYICDPACGSGTFLIDAMKAVTEAVPSSPGV